MVVTAQVINHIHTNDLSTVYQSAYKLYHFTETALLYIKNDIQSSLSKGVPSVLILLDLSAAFDTIDHAALLGGLRHMYGISAVTFK